VAFIQVASMNKGIPVSLSLPRIVNGREEQLYMGSNDRLGHGAMRSLKSADGPPVPLTMDVVDSPRVKSEIKVGPLHSFGHSFELFS